MASIKPIGFFDSGVGGTSIWREVYHLLPNENTVYLADSKHAPYGIKSQEEIQHLSERNTEFLLELGAKIIVVACNTATTNAIDKLRAKYPVPFIGIEPAIKPASLKSKKKSIGILATKGTLSSSLFLETSSLYSSGIKITEQVGTGLVELIEKGDLKAPALKELLKEYLEPMKQADIDYLVLGCSHYPYLIPLIKEILPDTVEVIDSGLAVAKQTKAILEKNNLLNQENPNRSLTFYSNKDTQLLNLFVPEAKEKDIFYLSSF